MNTSIAFCSRKVFLKIFEISLHTFDELLENKIPIMAIHIIEFANCKCFVDNYLIRGIMNSISDGGEIV